ncbi:MAG: hypothetical protein HKN18_05150 [Silicimonas sp.]|nr:hypothetical protein [Silicimonas sp.]
MNNVISFPQPAVAKRVSPKPARSMTLFLHVKCSTLIIHLADNPVIPQKTGRAGKS